MLVIIAAILLMTYWVWPAPHQSEPTPLSVRDWQTGPGRSSEPLGAPGANELANTELEIAALDACAARLMDKVTKAAGPNPFETGGFEAVRLEQEGILQQAVSRLAVSTSAEHRLAAALMEQNPARSSSLISEAMIDGKDDVLVAWHAAGICTKTVQETGCPLQAWEEQLLSLDGQNTEVWSRVAANRLDAGDNTGALSAMQSAATAPETNIYWPETVAMTERALSAAGDLPFAQRVSTSFGVGAASGPGVSAIVEMCRNMAPVNSDWAYACLGYGERGEQQGKGILTQQIARAIQKIALLALGEEERASIVEARAQSVRHSFPIRSPSRELSEALMLTRPSFFYRYLTAVRQHGEVAAFERMDREAERWMLSNEGLECSQ